MKRIFAVVATLALALNVAFAATPTTEPSLPADIGTWEKLELSCTTRHAEGVFLQEDYRQVVEGSLKFTSVVTLNGQKVAQSEYSEARGSASFVQYVKNSPENNWLAYGQEEMPQAIAHFLSEIGLTKEQFESCADE
ncbi:MAG: hypothetical protein Q7S52_05540 [bacterium]|nr:hypothetical protein [bacterium]